MRYDEQIRLATLKAAIDGGHHKFVSIVVENGANVNAAVSVSLGCHGYVSVCTKLYLHVLVLSCYELGLPC